MKKNRISLLAIVLLIFTFILSACGQKNVSDNKKKIVCTIFPEYDWVREILGEKASDFDISLLLDSGTDIHSFQPSAADIVKISVCDLFIYVGGESDAWVDDALKESTNSDKKVINLLQVLGDSAKEEEIVEGMEASEEDEEAEEGVEYDEHVWLSIKNAMTYVDVFADSIKELDPDNAAIYEQNACAYKEKLAKLDEAMSDVVAKGDTDTLLFGDRFPFRYLVDDYNLSYYAAFVGCSAETQASFETVIFLAGKVDELSLGHVLVIENSDKKIAETVINNTSDKNQDILVLDSLQSVTKKDIDGGTTYLSKMTDNLAVLEAALSK